MSSTDKNSADSNSASITFNWVGQGKEVGIMGAFGLPNQSDWVPMPMTYSNELKGYQISLDLKQEKMYQYKFVVDGDRICDPKADTTNDSEGHLNNMVYIPLLDSTPSGQEAHNEASSNAILKDGEYNASRKASMSVAPEGESACSTSHDSNSNGKECSTGAERHVSFDPATLGEHYEPVDLSDPEGCPKKVNYLSENVYYSKSVPKSLESITEADKDTEQISDSRTHSNESTSKAPRHAEDLKLPYKSRRRGLPKFNSVNPSTPEASKESQAHAHDAHTTDQAGEHNCHDGDQAVKLRCLADSQSNNRFDEETQVPEALEASSEEPAASCTNTETVIENDVRSATPPPEASAAESELAQPCSGEAKYANLEPSSAAPSRKLSGAEIHYSEEVAPVNTGASYVDSSVNADLSTEAYATEDLPVQEQSYDNQHYAEEYDLPVATKEIFENDADLVDDSAEMPYSNAGAIPDSSDLSYAATPGNHAPQVLETLDAPSNHYESNAVVNPDTQQVVGEPKEEEVHTGYYCPVSRKFTYGVAPAEEVQEDTSAGNTYATEATLAPQESAQYGGASSRKQSDAHDGLSSYYDPVQRKFIIVSQDAPVEATGNQAYGSSAPGHESAYFDAASGKFVVGTKAEEEAQDIGYSVPNGGEHYAAAPPQEAYAKVPSPYEAHVQNAEASYEKPSSYFDVNTGMFVHGYQAEPAHYAAPQETYAKAPSSYEAHANSEASYEPSTENYGAGYQREPVHYVAAPHDTYAGVPSSYEAHANPGVSHEKPSSYFDANTGTFVHGYQHEPAQYTAPHEAYSKAPVSYEAHVNPDASYEKPSSYFDANTGTFVHGYQREPAQYGAPHETYVKASVSYGAHDNAEASYEKPSHYEPNTEKYGAGYQREPVHYAAAPHGAYARPSNAYEAQPTTEASYEKPHYAANGYQHEPAHYAAAPHGAYARPSNAYEVQPTTEAYYEKPHYAVNGYQHEPVHYAAAPQESYTGAPSKYAVHANHEAHHEKPSSYFDVNSGTFVHGNQREPAEHVEAAPHAYASKPNTHEVHPTTGASYEKPHYAANPEKYAAGYQHDPTHYSEPVHQVYNSQPKAYDSHAVSGVVYEKPAYYEADAGKYTSGYRHESAHYAEAAPRGYTSKPSSYEAHANPEASYEKPSYFDASTGNFVHGYQQEPVHYVPAPEAAYASKNEVYESHNVQEHEKPSTYIDENTEEFDVKCEPEAVEVPQIYVSQPDTYEATENTGAPGYYDFAVGKFIHDSQEEPEQCASEPIVAVCPAAQEQEVSEKAEPVYPPTEEQQVSEPTETCCPVAEEQIVSEPTESHYPVTEEQVVPEPTETSYPVVEQEVPTEACGSTTEPSQPVPAQEPLPDTCTSCGKSQEKAKTYPAKPEAHSEPKADSVEKRSEAKPSRPVPSRKPTVVGENPHNSEPAPKKTHPNDSSDSLNDSVHGSQHGSTLGSKVTAKWRPLFKKVAPGKLRMVSEQQSAPKANGHCNSSRGGQYAREADLTFNADMDHSYGGRPGNANGKVNNYHTQADNRDMYPSEYMDGDHQDPQEEDFLNQLGQDSGPQTPRDSDSSSFLKGGFLSELPFFSKTTLIVFVGVYMMASFKGPSSSLSIMMVLPLLCLLALSVAAMNISNFIKHNNIGWKCNDNLTVSIFQSNEHASTHAITLNTNHIITAFFLALALVGIISMVSISGFYVVGAFAKRSCY